MTRHAAQHASPLPPVAPVHPLPSRPVGWTASVSRRSEVGAGAALAAVWAASWIYLLAAVAAPAGRLHAQAVRPDRADPAALARAALAAPPANEDGP